MINFITRITSLLLIIALFLRFSERYSIEPNSELAVLPPYITDSCYWVDSVMQTLSPTERVAQLVFVAVKPKKEYEKYADALENVRKYNLGGIILFHCQPNRAVEVINQFQAAVKVPLMVSIDGEWGLSMRIDSTITYPKQMMLGAIADDKLIYQMGADMAWQCRRIGIHLNYAPCVDINNNPRNPVINSRSFGEEKDLVCRKAYAYMAGMQDNYLLTTAKHFPGHGDTEVDSHKALPIIPWSLQRLDSLEMWPYSQLINSGLGGVMVAHLHVPQIDSALNVPSTLSAKVVDSILIKRFNFKGLVFTDAMDMKGVANVGSYAQNCVKAFKAGNDILLMPEEIPSVIEALKQVIDSSEILQSQVDSRCRKVLLAKYWLGLNKYRPADNNNIYKVLNNHWLELTQRKLVEAGLTLLKNKNNLLPLQYPDTLKIASIAVGGKVNNMFQNRLSSYMGVDNYWIEKDAPEAKFDSIRNILAKYNLVIAALLGTDMRQVKNFGVTDGSIKFLNSLADTTNLVLGLFANPYVLERFIPTNNYKAILLAYEDKELNQDYAAQAIMGGIGVNGRLSVKASDEYTLGTCFVTQPIQRLKYTIPEELGLSSKKFEPIDTFVNWVIINGAMPGCQVYIAKDGKVIWNKAYGYYTYDKTQAVKTTDLYDLASITKIAATTTAIMRLHDHKKIRLNNHLEDYISMPDTCNKRKLKIANLLAHQSKLMGWIPFYINTIKCTDPNVKLISRLPSKTNTYKVNESTYLCTQTQWLNGYYSKTSNPNFTIPVADSMYINNNYPDSIFNRILNSPLRKKEGYMYSDLGFILLAKAVENKTKVSISHYMDSVFYKPLGAWSLTYQPLTRFSKNNIVPTENDVVFRHQLVQGYVHDPAAAMLGGVAGHAGLFGNANDVGKLMQLYLNKGSYAGHRYLSENTINEFTACHFGNKGNRRGYGFDKPEPDSTKASPVSKLAPLTSYGHTGFTGTLAWVDPDENLVYIFLSNRVHPDQGNNKLVELNVRTAIQDQIYKAIKK